MAKKRSETVSGLGLALSFMTALDDARQKAGLSDEEYHPYLDSDKQEGQDLIGVITEHIVNSKPQDEVPILSFPIWKTITMGGVPKDKLLTKLQEAGFNISDWAKDIISKSEFTTAERKYTIKLIRCQVRDLGFTENPTTDQLFAKIKQVGQLCPAEVGPHLRLQFTDQAKGDYCWVAMKPITVSDGFPYVFNVRRCDDGERWLFGDIAEPDDRWDLGYDIVFVSRK